MSKKRRNRPVAQKRREERKSAEASAQFSTIQHEKGVLATLWGELKAHWVFLLVITIAGLVTRLWQVWEPSLWMDEIAIQREAYADEYQAISYTTHMVHLEIVGFFMHLFGRNEFGLRFYGAVMGGLSIPLVYVWARWMMNNAVAQVAALFALANSFLLIYAQDGNYYGSMTFFTAVMLCAYALFFRGAPHAAFGVLIVAAGFAYKTHPVMGVPIAVMGGGMVLGAIVFPYLRQLTFTFTPAQWKNKPALPILSILLILFLASSPGERVLEKVRLLTQPGEGLLRNVSFGWPLFHDHLTAYGVSFFRMGNLEHAFFWVPLVLFAAAIAFVLVRWKKEENPAFLSFAGLLFFLPLASYVMIFTLRLDRNFYPRYFIYMVPMLMTAMAFAVVELHRLITPRRETEHSPLRDPLLLSIAALPFLLLVYGSARYLYSELSNYKPGMEYLQENYSGEPIISPTKMDRTQAQFYLREYDLPRNTPDYKFFPIAGHEGAYGGSWPFMFNGAPKTWILAAWRFIDAPELYDVLAQLKTHYKGTNKISHENDLHIHEWDFDDRVVYSHAAAKINFEDAEGETPVLFAGPGNWELSGSNASVPQLDEWRHERMTYENPQGEWTLVPQLPDEIFYSFDQAANQLHHTKVFLDELNGETYLRNNRDDSYDFLVFQPEGEPRQLVVRTARRDENHELLDQNNGDVPPGLFIAIAVDGKHRGYWFVESGEPEKVRLPIDLNLEPGNHRITVSGLVPRIPYRPYFPWLLQGIEWNATHDEARSSMEEQGEVELSPGWPSTPPTGQPGQQPQAAWNHSPNYEVLVDPEMQGPAGDPAIRVTFPGDKKENFTLTAPPMPVQSGTLATFWFYFHAKGMKKHELTPAVAFLNAQGNSMGQSFVNGPNFHGTTYGDGWIRRQITVPVPDGAAYLTPVMQFFTYPEHTEEGNIWLASFGSPGTDAEFGDPQLPGHYFGFAGEDAQGE